MELEDFGVEVGDVQVEFGDVRVGGEHHGGTEGFGGAVQLDPPESVGQPRQQF